MEEDKTKIIYKILECYRKEKNIEKVKKKFNLSYSKLMDIIISAIENQEIKNIFINLKNGIEEQKRKLEEYKRLEKLRKQKQLELDMLKSYKKILSSEPEYICIIIETF